jgi:hypothetical protein
MSQDQYGDAQHTGKPWMGSARTGFACHSNKLGRSELATMPKNKPITGPMRLQPIRDSVIPMMSSVGKVKRAPQSKQEPTKTEAISVEKARITRLTSLRKQRHALKG